MDDQSTSISLPEDLAELRRAQIKAHGVMVLDLMFGQAACTKCRAPAATSVEREPRLARAKALTSTHPRSAELEAALRSG